MKTAILRGREHLRLGAVDAVAEGAAAIALSKGGAPKTYEHTDPNEDAAAFAVGRAGLLAAVADGHRGHEAAEIVLTRLLEEPALAWTSGGLDAASWPRQVEAFLCDANQAILAGRNPLNPARTTLSLALVLPDDDLLLTASMGDSHCFRVGPRAVQELARGTEAELHYLGHEPETPASIQRKCRTEARPLGETRAIVLATDGLSEVGVGVADPSAVVLERVDQAAHHHADVRPLEVARGVLETALEAQAEHRSGDNAASAVVWISAR
ncbi:MAG: protein phosphatase 2C domain-containing protein [Myxococcota bacterium]|nr:protein phosphatase 2C domain-containing protein [Myxococcota bacterium]